MHYRKLFIYLYSNGCSGVYRPQNIGEGALRIESCIWVKLRVLISWEQTLRELEKL